MHGFINMGLTAMVHLFLIKQLRFGWDPYIFVYAHKIYGNGSHDFLFCTYLRVPGQTCRHLFSIAVWLVVHFNLVCLAIKGTCLHFSSFIFHSVSGYISHFTLHIAVCCLIITRKRKRIHINMLFNFKSLVFNRGIV